VQRFAFEYVEHGVCVAWPAHGIRQPQSREVRVEAVFQYADDVATLFDWQDIRDFVKAHFAKNPMP
jgi:hypothetical protein